MGRVEEFVEPRDLTRCFCLWGFINRNPCPNSPAAIIVSERADAVPGFSVMCEVHRDGFVADVAPGGWRVEPYSLKLAERLQRELREW